MALDSIVVLAVSLVQKFTGSVAEEQFGEENAENRERNQDDLQSELAAPLLITPRLDDLNRSDVSDTAYEEYTNPRPLADPLAWKKYRPSCGVSLLQCSYVGLTTTLIGGIGLGLPAVALLYLDMNTADFCHWKNLGDVELPKLHKDIRVASALVIRPFINFTPLLLLMMIFKWQLIKDLNLVTITLLATFIDISYRLLLGVFEIYNESLQLYPPNALFCLLVLILSYTTGKNQFPTKRIKAIKGAFKLGAQFFVGLPITYLYVYVIFPWFAQQKYCIGKAVVAGIAPLTSLPVKVISRICAIHSEGLTHLGTSHVLLAVAYSAPSIAFRFMQADFESLTLFVALSIGDGIAHVLERSTILFRDYLWEKMARACFKGEIPMNRPYRTPRSQRLLADMSIQGMLFESVALVIALAIKHLYPIVYQDIEKGTLAETLIDFSERISIGLGIIFLSNVSVSLILTRQMNVAILKVWKRKWKSHCLVSIIVTVLVVFYFSHFALQLVRAGYECNRNLSTRPLNFTNCTAPFEVFR